MSLGKRRQLTPVMNRSKSIYKVYAESFFLQEAHCGSNSLIQLQLIQPHWKMSQKLRSAELYVSFLIVISINT